MKLPWLPFPPPLRIGIPLLVLLFSLVYDVLNTLVLTDGEVGRAYTLVENLTKGHAATLADTVAFDNEVQGEGKFVERELKLLKSQNSEVLWAAVVDQSNNHKFIYSTNPEWVGRSMSEVGFDSFAVAVVDQTIREPKVRHIKRELNEKSILAFSSVTASAEAPALVALVSRDFWQHVHSETMESYGEGATSGAVHLVACLGLWWVLNLYLSGRLEKLRESIGGIGQRIITPTMLKGGDEYAQISRLLWERESIFQQLVNNIRDVIYLVSADGRQIFYLSPSFVDLWGFQPPHGSSSILLLEYVFPEDQSRVRGMLVPLSHGKEAVHCEYRIKRPDGTTRWVESRAFPVRDENGVLYRVTGLMADITDRKELEQQILEISERERHRIGYDLHDDLCQRLAAIKLNAELIEDKIAKGKLEDARTKSLEISRHIGDAAALCRSLARGLSPVNMDGGGFTYALQKLIETAAELYKIECKFDCPEPITIANSTTATHLYRITQELINNAARHAKPKKILVSLHEEDENQLKLAVINDGLNFMEKVPSKEGGMGLQIIRYRADAIDANFQFLPRPDGKSGTLAVCYVPLTMC